MKSELKPCPFCGSDDVSSKYEIESIYGKNYVRCDNCGIRTKGFFYVEQAIESWNRRVDDGQNQQ